MDLKNPDNNVILTQTEKLTMGKPKTTQKLADEMQADYKIVKQNGLVMNNDNDESRRLVEHCYPDC